jgi:hypothetical protein
MSDLDLRLVPVSLMIAVLIALPEVIPQPRRHRQVGFVTAFVGMLLVFLIGPPPPTQPSQRGGKDRGVIVPDTVSLIQVGRGGVAFDIGDNQMRLWKDSELVIKKINGRLSVSTVIRDHTGRVIGRIRDNQWEVYPSAWDWNYSDDALEIKNSIGEVVFQARIVGNVLQLQGEWYTRDGTGVRLVEILNRPGVGAQLQLSYENGVFPMKAQTKIRELFKYPSRDFFGELVS